VGQWTNVIQILQSGAGLVGPESLSYRQIETQISILDEPQPTAQINSGDMKKIEAVICPAHLNAVRMELERRGIRGGLTLVEVRYAEGDKWLLPTERGGSGNFQERVKLELMLDDSEAEKAVSVILRHAQPQSDEEGGQIAVLEVNEILRIGPA
jgi:nitrogen regulatory protein PII